MPKGKVTIYISGNNDELEKLLLKNSNFENIKFSSNSSSLVPYAIFFIDLNKNISLVSQKLIEVYALIRKRSSKLAVVLLHADKIDAEKNQYFEKMLNDLGGNRPSHRLIISTDLYQTVSPVPVTYLDEKHFSIMLTGRIDISKKGKNTLHPISVNDFIKGILKTLFLQNTEGKKFWLLGDPITDLEMGYLFKKYLEQENQKSVDINTINKDETEGTSLNTLANTTQGEINWHPEEEYSKEIKNLFQLQNLDTKNDIDNHKDRCKVFALISTLKLKKIKKNSGQKQPKKIIKKIIIGLTVVLFALALTAGVTVVMSLKNLQISVRQALMGDLSQSINSLTLSSKYYRVSETLLHQLIPVGNLISTKQTEKVANVYTFLDYSLQSVENLHQTYVMSENLLLSLGNQEFVINYEDYSLALRSNLLQVYENLNQIIFLSSQAKIPSYINNKIQASLETINLETLKTQISQYVKVIDLIPKILSENKAVNLLILLQNSRTITPSGGDIEHYLLLKLNHANIVSKQYLKKEELGQQITHPDFSTYAQQIGRQSVNTHSFNPDFVIALNEKLIVKLLEQDKPDELKVFIEKTRNRDSDSLIKEYFDLYLSRLFDHDIKLPVVGRALSYIINDSQVLIWASDGQTQKLIAPQSFSGVIYSHPCVAGLLSTDNCLAETTYLSEVHTPKTNELYYDKREMGHKIIIKESSIEHEYRLEYTINPALTTKDSIQIKYDLYLPSNTFLDQILLNGMPLSLKPVITLPFSTFNQYSIPLELQPKDSLVVIKALSKKETNFSLPLSYSIVEYRQAGLSDGGSQITLIYPENTRPSVVTSSHSKEPQTIQYKLPPQTSVFGLTLMENTL